MLENLNRPPREKKVSLDLSEPALALFLAELLRSWRCRILDAPAEGGLHLVDEERPRPAADLPLLRLSRGGVASPGRLVLPLALEDLWEALERRFHVPPRLHMRIGTRHPLRIEYRGEIFSSELRSLSDRGARFAFPGEVASGERMRLRFRAGEREFDLEGGVIYVIIPAERSGPGGVEIGIVFDRLGEDGRKELRELIVHTTLERVRDAVGAEVFEKIEEDLRRPEGRWMQEGVLKP